jgi:Zn-dependent M28 family amino/carboxypeptidase
VTGTDLNRYTFLLGAFLYAAAAQARAMQPDATQPAGAPHFDETQIRETIRTLSSDRFDGRAPASVGEQRTIAYLATRFRQLGLRPADKGSFLQAVPMVQITPAADAVLAISGGAAPLRFAYGSDIVITTPRPEATVSLKDSALVFAGYGIVAPEYQWNDYAGLDVRGKTVVVLVNDPGYATEDPALFHGKAMTYYGRWTYKYEEAARQGAAGVLIVHDTGPAGYSWEVVRNSWAGPADELPPGKAYLPQIQGWLSHEAASQLFAAAGQDLATLASAATHRDFKAVDLHMTASLTLHNQVHEVVSHNVVALLKGTRHPEQVVVYTAHWDHFGEKPGADGKPQIFHGAVDNGTGVAGLIALARRFSSDKPAPERSLLFVATTCEEMGLLGSAYYAAHPLFPLADTVASLNMDEMDTYGATRDLTVRGQFMSTLDDLVKHEAASLGLQLLPDADPSKGYYFRADHFEFAKQGVPALSVYWGTDYVGHPPGWGLAQQRDFNQQRYHKPQDVYDAAWNLAGMEQQLQVLYLTGRALAHGDDWPEWYPDSPFRAKRAARQAQGP